MAAHIGRKPRPSAEETLGGRATEQVRNNLRQSRLAGHPATLTPVEWLATLVHFGRACAYCGTPGTGLYIEHVTPTSHGGGTTAGNCVPSCKWCNSRKHSRALHELGAVFEPDRLEKIRAWLAPLHAAHDLAPMTIMVPPPWLGLLGQSEVAEVLRRHLEARAVAA